MDHFLNPHSHLTSWHLEELRIFRGFLDSLLTACPNTPTTLKRTMQSLLDNGWMHDKSTPNVSVVPSHNSGTGTSTCHLSFNDQLMQLSWGSIPWTLEAIRTSLLSCHCNLWWFSDNHFGFSTVGQWLSYCPWKSLRQPYCPLFRRGLTFHSTFLFSSSETSRSWVTRIA